MAAVSITVLSHENIKYLCDAHLGTLRINSLCIYLCGLIEAFIYFLKLFKNILTDIVIT
ncbi:hypothetical protein NERG_01072 [Nematocida ausubeli]|uniref:Uncharacterized protein n=1 Tax=Nematocida ausubeli (strain ATCC PRA-371 / ERTm2) TaxID=1913371 RepID=H8ZCS5_NEMA1|nr:hypothetical protein NERG_01072 [Nematocida ausubeli]